MPLCPAERPHRRHRVLKLSVLHLHSSSALGWANRNLTGVQRLQQSQKLLGPSKYQARQEFVSSTGRMLPYPFEQLRAGQGGALGWPRLFRGSAAAPGTAPQGSGRGRSGGTVPRCPWGQPGTAVLEARRMMPHDWKLELKEENSHKLWY